MFKAAALLFFVTFLNQANASLPEDVATGQQGFKVNGTWYNIPPAHFLFESSNPDLTFGEAMRISNRLDMKFEIEPGRTKLALNSQRKDHVHQFRFLLMLEACNDYKVTTPPLVRQVLEAYEALRNAKPNIIAKMAVEPEQKKAKTKKKAGR